MFSLMALVLAVQAPAADGPFRCIVEPMTPQERAELSQGAANGGTLTPVMEARLQAVVRACTTQYGWDPSQAGSMTVVAISHMILEHVGGRLVQAGVAPARIEGWLARQDEALQTRMAFTDAQGQQLMLDLNAEGVRMSTLEANAEMIGAYLGALVMINRVNRKLPVL